MIAEREAHITVVFGGQGVGKTVRQKLEGQSYAMNDVKSGKTGSKVLVIDCNPQSGSYDGIPTIDYNTEPLDLYKHGKVVQDNSAQRCAAIRAWPKEDKSFRRVVNRRKKDGQPMDINEMNRLCLDLLKHFSQGMLILEDTNVYLQGAAQRDFISNFVTMRHKSADLVIILQSWNAIQPKVAANMSLIRLHKTYDKCDRRKNEIADTFEMVKIGELIVNKQHEMGNVRYFVYLDLRNKKIIGADQTSFYFACRQYLYTNRGVLREYMAMNGMSEAQAMAAWTKQKAGLYLKKTE